MTRESTDPAAPGEHSAPDSVRGPVVGRLLSVNVGMPKNVPWQGKTVFTGVFKDPVSGPRRVGKLNVEGDGQGDLAGHGGEQRAVFVYQIDSYRYWERELGRDDFVYGQFGENFTVEGLGDDEVCIGDRYQIGSCGLRGDAAPRHLLPRRDPDERPADPRLARLTPSPGLLLPRARRGRRTSGRRDHQARAGTRTDAGRRGRRAALPPRAPAPATAAGAPDPRPQPRLAGILPSSARRSTRQRQRRPRGDEPASRLAGLPPADGHGNHPRERLGDLDTTRGSRRRATAARAAGPVPHAARPTRQAAAVGAAQLLPLRAARTPATTGSPSSANADGVASGYLHTRLAVGDQLDIAAPRGTFILDQTRCTRAADQRRDRCHPSSRHASCTRARSIPIARSGGCTPHATAASTRSPPRPGLCSPRSRTHAAACITAVPVRTIVEGRDFDIAGRLTASQLAELQSARAMPRHTCAGPTAFMDEISAGSGGARDRRLTHPHRAVRTGTGPDARDRGGTGAGAPPARRPARKRSDDRVRPQRPHDPMGQRLRQPARTRRSVRRARPLVVPHRRLPHLRDHAHRRRASIQPRAGRTPRRGKRTHLLLTATRRRGARPVTGSKGRWRGNRINFRQRRSA